jgi:hypothetical protein
MKIVGSWNDLADYGIKPLTGEACGLMYRILFDVTERGKQIIEKCFDAKIELTEPWNRDAIGSIMLPHEMLVPLGIFALLESGCREVWRNGEMLIGVEQDDPDNQVERAVRKCLRRYAYHGTAGSRNRHEFTRRVT